MADRAAPDWAALGRVFGGLARPPSAAETEAEAEDLARDLADERAAILEYCAGLPRAEAERRAELAHGVSFVDRAPKVRRSCDGKSEGGRSGYNERAGLP